MPKKLDKVLLLLLSPGRLMTDIYRRALPAILPFLKDRPEHGLAAERTKQVN